MSYEGFIGTRYLLPTERSRMVSIITVIAVLGVATGVTAMIVVLSVMEGFTDDLKDKLLSTRSHIVVSAEGENSLIETDRISSLVEIAESQKDVRGISPFVEGEVMISSPTNLNGAVVRGVEPGTVPDVSELDEFMKNGSLSNLDNPKAVREATRDRDASGVIDEMEAERGESGGENGDSEGESSMPALPGDESFNEEETGESRIPPGIVLGAELARALRVDVGNEVNVVTPRGEIGPTGPIPRSQPFVVAGVFESGLYEVDANQALIRIDEAREFFNKDGVSGIEIEASSIDRAPTVARALEEKMPEEVAVEDWREMNRSLFFALRLEKIAMFVVLAFIILVASFSIVAMLIMTVIEKSQQISVLKAMGMSDGGVVRIFVFQGLVIGTVGTAIGGVLGLGICWFLAEVGLPLDSEVYYISQLPVAVDWGQVGAIVGCALLISGLATVYPAYLAARLNPVEGLRDE